MADVESTGHSVARLVKRKNTSRACEDCRRRRAKCDGRRPSCSRCIDRALNCHYTIEEDGRRPAPKPYVQLLRNRINVLERIIRAHSIDVDQSVAQLMREDKSLSTDWVQSNGPEHEASRAIGPANSFSFQDLCAAFEGTLSLDESLNFDQDGEVRYFGPTSGRLEFQSVRDRSIDDTGFSPESVLDEPSGLGWSRSQFNKFCQDLVEENTSQELQSHLIDLYFTWEQPWGQSVNEKLFRHSLSSNGRYSSTLLLYCILCLGCRYSSKVEVRSDPSDPNTAGRLYLDKIEVLLHHELKWPSITTIQSLSILSTIYVAFGADAAGWLHQGMAIRLAIDMGINLDSASLPGSSSLPQEEVELRRQIYWSLYCHDKLFASYTGRVCTFLDSQAAVELPSLPQLTSDQMDVTPLHVALISLSQNLEKILLSLYAPKPSHQGSQRATFFESCLLELKNWSYDLPSGLRLEKNKSGRKLPHVYTLHMTYRTSFILLMKPFLSKLHTKGMDQTDQVRASSKLPDNISQKANKICLQSAREIVSIAREYRREFGSFSQSPLSATHCTLSAVLILLKEKNLRGTKAAAGIDSEIKICLQVLKELSASWNPAKRLWQNVEKLYQKLTGPQLSPTDVANPDLQENISPTVEEMNELYDMHGTMDFQAFDSEDAFAFDLSFNNVDSEIQGMIDEALFSGPTLAFPSDWSADDYTSFDILNRGHHDTMWQ